MAGLVRTGWARAGRHRRRRDRPRSAGRAGRPPSRPPGRRHGRRRRPRAASLGGRGGGGQAGRRRGVCRALPRPAVTRVLSIAAGVSLASLESWLAEPTPVVRAMPNMPALVGAGAAAIAGGRAAGPDDLAWAQSVLEAVGTVVDGPRVRPSMPSPGCRARARPTCSCWPRPSSTPACWSGSAGRSPASSRSRPCWGRPACWTRPATSRPPSGPRSPPPAARPPPACGPGGGGVRHAVLEAVAAAAERSRQLGGPTGSCLTPADALTPHFAGGSGWRTLERCGEGWCNARATKRVPVPVRHRGRGGRSASGVQHDRLPADPVRPAAGDPGRPVLPDPSRRTSTATWRSSTPAPAD